MDGGAERFSAGLIVRMDGSERELIAVCDPAEPAARLIDALLAEVGLPAGGDLYVARTGRRLDPDQPLTAQPLAHGDLLSPQPLERPDASDIQGSAAAYELVGAGGVGIGGRWPLRPGRQHLGRSKECEIVVDDSALSRTHLVLDVQADEVTVSDAGSTNGTFIAGVRVSGQHLLVPGDVIEAGASLFTVEKADAAAGGRVPEADGFIRFNRPPRVTPAVPIPSTVLPAPPEVGQKPRLPLASAALPLVAAIVLWRLFPDNPSLLLIMALSPLMVVFSFLEERRQGRGSARTKEKTWREELKSAMSALARDRSDAVELERTRSPGAAQLERAAASLTPELWLRRPGDPDFLLLRCGWGDRRWAADPSLQAGGSEALREEALAQIEPLRVLPSVPLTASLSELKVIGLTGDAPRLSDLLRWLIVQLATLHSPEELAISLLVPDDDLDEWSWATWLPHLRNHPFEGSLRPAVDQLHEVLRLLEARQAARVKAPAVAVVLDDRSRLPRALTSRVLRDGPDVGIHVLWAGSRREELPGECAALVELDQQDGMSLTVAASGETVTGAFEGLDTQSARRVATALAPIRDAAPRSTARELPSRVALFDVLEVAEPDAAWVSRQWGQADDGLNAPVGKSTEGLYRLDLINAGPHALVGGTTGSGKSELLQTMVASLAARYPPTLLNFLLIDYKGGAAFKDCSRLPHVVGSVTDLDARLSERALVSLDAEIRRREAFLRDAGVGDVRDLRDRSEELPRLLLVIDEFATLIKELPGFVEGVVDIAQRGRSLGIHLVLATQRPAGVINDAIRANTNLRIALRMADETDSENVVGIKDAAHMPRSLPGRAFVRTGHGEVRELQVAFAGAVSDEGRLPTQVWDRRQPAPTTQMDKESRATHLAQLIDAVHAAAQATGYPPPRKPWLPALPDVLALSGLGSPPGERRGVATLGLTDLPSSQRQQIAQFDPANDGGLLVFGAGRAGKTTALRTIAASLASSATTEEVHLYGIDYGVDLRVLKGFPHVGDVVTGEEPRRVDRLFRRLRNELNRRKQGVKQEAGGTRPVIVVLLDGYGAFATAFERVDLGALVDGLPALVAEGRSVGIHFVIAAERRAGVPQALVATMDRKLVLRMGDPDEYAALGLDARRLRDARLPPGRGFIDGTEIQVATLSGTTSATHEIEALENLAHSLPDGPLAPAEVRLLPTALPSREIDFDAPAFQALLGLVETDDLAPGSVDLEFAHFLVAGPYRSGRSTALATMATSLHRSTPDATLHLLAPRKTPLSHLPLWETAAAGVERCGEEIDALSSAFAEDPERPRFIVIDDADELLDGASTPALESLVRRGRDSSTRFVVAGEIRALHRAFSGWITEIRKDKHGLLLDPDPDVDGDLLGVRLPRGGGSLPPGRGYLVRRGTIEEIQVATPPSSGG